MCVCVCVHTSCEHETFDIMCVCVCVCFQTALLSATAYQYSLPVEVNAYYTVYVVAVANHGSSQPTERITAVIAESKCECYVLTY